jgi:hypothetical protein
MSNQSVGSRIDGLSVFFCLVLFWLIGVGASGAYVVSLIPVWCSSIFGAGWVGSSIFFGMVFHAVYWREKYESKMLDVENRALKTFDEQEKLHRQMRRDAVWLATHRVAMTMIKEMMHNLKNDEQRSAALIQARHIIEKEIRLIQIERAMQEIVKDEIAEKKEEVVKA